MIHRVNQCCPVLQAWCRNKWRNDVQLGRRARHLSRLRTCGIWIVRSLMLCLSDVAWCGLSRLRSTRHDAAEPALNFPIAVGGSAAFTTQSLRHKSGERLLPQGMIHSAHSILEPMMSVTTEVTCAALALTTRLMSSLVQVASATRETSERLRREVTVGDGERAGLRGADDSRATIWAAPVLLRTRPRCQHKKVGLPHQLPANHSQRRGARVPSAQRSLT